MGSGLTPFLLPFPPLPFIMTRGLGSYSSSAGPDRAWLPKFANVLIFHHMHHKMPIYNIFMTFRNADSVHICTFSVQGVYKFNFPEDFQ